MPMSHKDDDVTPDRPEQRRLRLVADALAAGRLTICSERTGPIHRIAVSGELDIATAHRVEDELTTVAATDADEIVLDLSGLAFIDSTGVHLIARASAASRAAGKRLRLERSPAHVDRVFELAAAAPGALPFAA